MRVIALSRLRDFWHKHPQSEVPLRSWYADASRADWKSPAQIKEAHRQASFVGGDRTVFNVKGLYSTAQVKGLMILTPLMISPAFRSSLTSSSQPATAAACTINAS